MVASSNTIKTQANSQFAAQDYSSAIGTYDRALAELPSYLDYEMAVLMSNIAACHLRLEQWKECVESCDKGLDGLEREMPTTTKKKQKSRKKGGTSSDARRKSKKENDDDGDGTTQKDSASNKNKDSNGFSRQERLNSDTDSDPDSEPSSPTIPTKNAEDDTVVELPSDTDEAAALANLQLSDARKSDIQRIRTKLLLRRARARSSITPETWTNLSAALEDYKLLSGPVYFSTLPASDQKTVRGALASLPPRVDAAKNKEVGEMMGKLKELGNGILKPFGLSTDNFKVVQGEGGGYSLSFDGGGGGGGERAA